MFGAKEGWRRKMARAVVEICEKPVTLTYPYALEESIETKITKIVQKFMGVPGWIGPKQPDILCVSWKI